MTSQLRAITSWTSIGATGGLSSVVTSNSSAIARPDSSSRARPSTSRVSDVGMCASAECLEGTGEDEQNYSKIVDQVHCSVHQSILGDVRLQPVLIWIKSERRHQILEAAAIDDARALTVECDDALARSAGGRRG